MLLPIFKKFIQFLDEFPEIGPRQAYRLFFWFIRQDEKKKRSFLEILKTIIEETKLCKNCFFPCLQSLCSICSDRRREKDLLCIVARETDVLTIENTKKYNGVYFILGGLILPFEEKEMLEERLKLLDEKLQNLAKKGKNAKVLIALPLTREAQPTLQKIERILKKYPEIKVKKPKKGMPLGGEIEFLDPETLKYALFEE